MSPKTITATRYASPVTGNVKQKKEELVQGSTLKIEPIHAYTTCLDCGEVYDTIQYAKICPKCHSEHTVLKTGNELLIKEIEAE